MTTSTTPTTGTCLICAREEQLSTSDGALFNHSDAEASAYCPGSGHTRVHNDGRDNARRFAIRAYTEVNAEARKKRNAFAAALEEGRKATGRLASEYLGDIVCQETAANLWRDLAIHGNWVTSLGAALRSLHGNLLHSSPVDEALWQLERGGTQLWLDTARRPDLIIAFAEGLTGDDVQTLLYNL